MGSYPLDEHSFLTIAPEKDVVECAKYISLTASEDINIMTTSTHVLSTLLSGIVVVHAD